MEPVEAMTFTIFLSSFSIVLSLVLIWFKTDSVSESFPAINVLIRSAISGIKSDLNIFSDSLVSTNFSISSRRISFCLLYTSRCV